MVEFGVHLRHLRLGVPLSVLRCVNETPCLKHRNPMGVSGSHGSDCRSAKQ